jgi:hypothetical protein
LTKSFLGKGLGLFPPKTRDFPSFIVFDDGIDC